MDFTKKKGKERLDVEQMKISYTIYRLLKNDRIMNGMSQFGETSIVRGIL
jgi:hypothetical protein